MSEDRNQPIVSGPEPAGPAAWWRDLRATRRGLRRREAPVAAEPPAGPVERLRDGLGRSIRAESSPELTVGAPAAGAGLERMEARDAAERAAPPPKTEEEDGLASIPLSWKPWVIGPVVLAFALFHVAPHLADLAGEPRDLLGRFFGPLPFGETLGHAAGGWLWEPVWVWVGAMALRLRALQRMVRDPPGAVMMALIAATFEAGFWIFMGLRQTGAYSPAEASALTLMLKIEGAAILGLFLLFAPTGKRKLGETDTHWSRG